MLSLEQLQQDILVGNDAGWALTFHTEDADGYVVETPVTTFSRDDYYGEIQATLPSDLAGGRYQFTIEGLTDEDYAKIAPFTPRNPNGTDPTKDRPDKSTKPEVVRLYLYWRDTNPGFAGDFASIVGISGGSTPGFSDLMKNALVAELAIVSVSRQAGDRRYEAVIKAQERVFKRLNDKKLRETRDSHESAVALATFLTGKWDANGGGVGIHLVTTPNYGFNADGTLPSSNATAQPAGAGGAGDGGGQGQTGQQSPGTQQQSPPPRDTYKKLLADAADKVADGLHAYARGIILIRDGYLHFGKRPIPIDQAPPSTPGAGTAGPVTPPAVPGVTGGSSSGAVQWTKSEPKALSYTNGLIQATRQPAAQGGGGGGGGGGAAGGAGAAASAAGGGGGGDTGGGGAAQQAVGQASAGQAAQLGTSPGKDEQWTLTLKGRPDIKPGHLVTFHLPPEEDPQAALTTTPSSWGTAALRDLVGVGGFEENTTVVTVYVTSVTHKLGRTSGFSTTVSGVNVGAKAGDDWPWSHDRPETAAASSPSAGAGRTQGNGSSPPADAATQIRNAAEAVVAQFRLPEMAEVRSSTSTGTGSTEPPAQTETVWRGLLPPDGRGNQGRRLGIERATADALNGVSYATPFAWGKVGLVLPRYPGTRVLLAHRKGEPNDPVDVGAVWESGTARESQAGDWWLSLPAKVAQADRAGPPSSADRPADYTGDVTNDLTDADGNRVIEVGELAIRVTRNSLTQAGTRPARGSEQDGITIEHVDGGAKITIAHDGKITIHANQGLEIVADQGDISITASAGDVKLQGTNIDAQVSGQMNVH
ncbi:MAG TPA: hypothetical protein VFV91_14510 [Gaiellaceae bacterium]|nr:hypothetical protein [Gaiellaceae bacterium]